MGVLKGATMVVAGGAGCLGRNLALEAGRRGARIVLADIAAGKEAVAALRAAGIEADFVQTEVSDLGSVRHLAERVRTEFGGANIITNCAVFPGGAHGALDDSDPETVRKLFDVNITGFYYMLHAFAKDLRAAAAAGEPAYVLNIGSEHTFGPPPHVTPLSMYTLTKSAVLAYSSVLRRDFAGSGVGVTMLSPGWIYTPVVQRLLESHPQLVPAILPYCQYPEFVAKAGIEGMLRGDFIVYPNSRANRFAIENFEEVIRELKRSEQIVAETPGPAFVQKNWSKA